MHKLIVVLIIISVSLTSIYFTYTFDFRRNNSEKQNILNAIPKEMIEYIEKLK